MKRSVRTLLVRSWLVPFVAAAAVLAAFDGAEASPLSDQFAKISIGLTQDAVVALMGTPASETDSSTLGLTHATLRWTDPDTGSKYVVSFLVGRVVQTTMCDSSTDC